MAISGVVRVADIVRVFPSIVHIPALWREQYCACCPSSVGVD